MEIMRPCWSFITVLSSLTHRREVVLMFVFRKSQKESNKIRKWRMIYRGYRSALSISAWQLMCRKMEVKSWLLKNNKQQCVAQKQKQSLPGSGARSLWEFSQDSYLTLNYIIMLSVHEYMVLLMWNHSWRVFLTQLKCSKNTDSSWSTALLILEKQWPQHGQL